MRAREHPAEPGRGPLLVEGHQAGPPRPPATAGAGSAGRPGGAPPPPASTAPSPTRPSRWASRKAKASPIAHRLAVGVAGEPAGRLDPVAEGVAQVEELARPVLGRVLGHHVHLHAGAGGDHRRVDLRGGAGLGERRQEPGVEGAVLDHLPLAAAQLAIRQGLEGGRVGQHRPRRVEGAHRVLGHRQVGGGLAADGGVDHGEQRGGDGDPGDAAHEGGRQEAAGVGDRAAAQGHHQAPPGAAGLEQGHRRPLQLGQGLPLLPVGQQVGDGQRRRRLHLGRDLGAERGREHLAAAHQGHAIDALQKRREGPGGARPDVDRVAVLPLLGGDQLHHQGRRVGRLGAGSLGGHGASRRCKMRRATSSGVRPSVGMARWARR